MAMRITDGEAQQLGAEVKRRRPCPQRPKQGVDHDEKGIIEGVAMNAPPPRIETDNAAQARRPSDFARRCLRRQVAFRQADVTRAARGAANAGLRISSIKIGPDGAIEILTAEPAPELTDAFGEWKAKRDARRPQRN